MHWVLFFTSYLTFAANDNGFHICYFSLNNEKEFTEMQKFTAQLNKQSPRKITVSEYLTKEGKPNDAFQEMIDSGVKCDGLVIQ